MPREMLLVLDNCEHVIDSAAAVAERLVGEAPQAHVLTTSREALRVEGEHVHLLYALDCLPRDGGLTAAEALKYPAVQLFMERAAASGYDAALSDSDAPMVATICCLLDGIVLAIELAASRAGSRCRLRPKHSSISPPPAPVRHVRDRRMSSRDSTQIIKSVTTKTCHAILRGPL